jgi:hypothetical protein
MVCFYNYDFAFLSFFSIVTLIEYFTSAASEIQGNK